MAPRKSRQQPKSGNGAPAARRQIVKRSPWAGVRFREPGRWAAEIRVPGGRKNAKVWIGAFESDRQAALAYDAAIFCMHGEQLPKMRKFNFPDVARPDIPEHVRLELTVDDVKDIARKHVHVQMGFVLPPPVAENNNLQVAAAAAEPEAAPAGPSSAGVGASGNDGSGSFDGMDGSFDETSAPFIFDPVELAAMVALVFDDN